MMARGIRRAFFPQPEETNMGLTIKDVHGRAGHARAPFSLTLSTTILICAQKLLRCLCQSNRVLNRALQSRHSEPNFCSILLSQWFFSAFCTLCMLSMPNTCLHNSCFMSQGRQTRHFAQNATFTSLGS